MKPRMMEIGSFLELDFINTGEYYDQKSDIARLNTGRAAIWHALRVLGGSTVWLPYYQCDTVREFLKSKNVSIKYYHIDCEFNPIDLTPAGDEAVLFVNYFGVMSHDRMRDLVKGYKKVIIDNSQAFFCAPVSGCMNVYSCRKFVGVPDGAYVIGKGAHSYVKDYEKGYSSDPALFLFQRIEYGCEGKAYVNRQSNERRIDTEDIKQMSELTHRILGATDYEKIERKRIENFNTIHSLIGSMNQIDAMKYYRQDCVPMVYPFVVENDGLLDKLQRHKHFQGHWWSYLLEEMKENDFEYWISRYVIPITIDQRYGNKEMNYIGEIICK